MISKRACNCMQWALFATLTVIFLLILNYTLHSIHPDKETRTESVQAVGE